MTARTPSRRLTFRDEQGARRRFTIGASPGEITLGRGPESTIRLFARDVSRLHARITSSGAALYLEDLGSRNGTFLNGVRVRRRRRLRGGDVLRLGDEVVCFEQLPDADTDSVTGAAATSPTTRPVQAAAATEMERTTLLMIAAAPRPRGWRGALAAALRAITRAGKG